MITFVAMAMSLAGTGAIEPRAPVAPATDVAAPVAASPVDTKRYCVEGTVTGSRLPQRECHTRAAWLNLGFDPLAAK